LQNDGSWLAFKSGEPGTVSLALTAADSSLAPETIGILKHRKWQDSDQLMGLDELTNAVNVTAAIANELNVLLPSDV
jgi:hypothetical protein